MSTSSYRVVVIGPGDEVLDTVSLDGRDLGIADEQAYLGEQVLDAMGGHHASLCADLPALDEDEL